MISEYAKRDEVKALLEAGGELPQIKNTNGSDYASCPRCRHYHAMMPAMVWVGDDIDDGKLVRFNYCRDCGELAQVV